MVGSPVNQLVLVVTALPAVRCHEHFLHVRGCVCGPADTDSAVLQWKKGRKGAVLKLVPGPLRCPKRPTSHSRGSSEVQGSALPYWSKAAITAAVRMVLVGGGKSPDRDCVEFFPTVIPC
jgi:hypothetical protein